MDRLKVCYFGTYRSEYSRNRILIKGLRKNGVEVIECHENLWTGIEDRVNAVEKGILNPKLWKRMFGAYFRLFKKFKNLPDFDVLIVGYPGQFDIYFAKFLTILKRKPIIWDVFMSIYLVSIERNLQKKSPISVLFLKIIEYLALRIPDKLIIDTEQYANWFNRVYKIPRQQFCLVPTGADDEVFYEDKYIEYVPNEKMKVLYYGTYIPNHGVPYIIEAANLLKDYSKIFFQMIGNGPELEICEQKIKEYGLSNIVLFPWMEQEELKNYIRQADVLLGAFGKTPQSLMTIQNKIYESMAMGKIVVTGESEAVKNQFINYTDIIMCDRDNPETLAKSLQDLCNNSLIIKTISKNSFIRYKKEFSVSNIGLRFLKWINFSINEKRN